VTISNVGTAARFRSAHRARATFEDGETIADSDVFDMLEDRYPDSPSFHPNGAESSRPRALFRYGARRCLFVWRCADEMLIMHQGRDR